MCLATVTHAEQIPGLASNYQLHPVAHLMFTDDLKVYEQSSARLAATLQQVENLSNAL